MYIPLKYTITAKYPRFYVVDQIMLVDMLMPIVATSHDAPTLILHALCIPIFVIAFMCVYEIGYFENDMKAARLEATPMLTDEVKRFLNYRVEPDAWIWALALTAAGSWLAVQTGLLSFNAMLMRTGVWLAALIAVRIVFYFYNRQEVANRPLGYFALQIFKYGGILVVFRPTVFGAVITAAQIAMMSAVYWIYRLGGRQRTVNKEVMRLAFACGIGIPLLLSGATTPIDSTMAASIAAGWLVLRLTKPPVMAALSRRRGAVAAAD